MLKYCIFHRTLALQFRNVIICVIFSLFETNLLIHIYELFIYIMNCIFLTSNVRLIDELTFSLMHSSSLLSNWSWFLLFLSNFFLSFFVQDQCLHILSQAPDLLFHHLTLQTVSDTHKNIFFCMYLFQTTVHHNCIFLVYIDERGMLIMKYGAYILTIHWFCYLHVILKICSKCHNHSIAFNIWKVFHTFCKYSFCQLYIYSYNFLKFYFPITL